MRRLIGSMMTVLVIAALTAPGIGFAHISRNPYGETIAARQRFFGKANVDARTGAVRPDRIIMSWFGVASYAVALRGHVVLFDAWVARGSHSGYVPTTPEEIATLDPEYVFLGHGDFDHAADAAQIVAESGATLVGSPEHCDSVRNQAPDADIECIFSAPRSSVPGTTKQLRLIPGVDITAITHVHSGVEPPRPAEWAQPPCIPIWNARNTAEHPPSPDDLQHLFRHLSDTRGSNILYQFRVGDFALAWHDTTGNISDDARSVIESLKLLPPTDVHFGAVLAFGQITNCFRSLRAYIDALSPKIYAATHHDNFTFFLGANARDLEPYVRAELDAIPEARRPELLYSYDRKDYIRPELFTFDPAARSWR